jgi:EAL domain-containing protein (putative c-di-GMP-specific phosphodiesterase class I)
VGANDDALSAVADEWLFRPTVALERRRLVGVEALIRWPGPALAARTLGGILATFRPWRAMRPELTLALSLHATSLADPALPERLGAALAAAGVPPSALVLGVAEGAVVADYVATADILTRLRMRGFRLALDDFGTGHASLLSLLRLPFSEIKIGRRFVATCRDDPEAPKIIRAMASLARGLGLQLGAEGIETEPVAALLAGLGCTVGQGGLFAPPLSPAAFGARLARAAWTGTDTWSNVGDAPGNDWAGQRRAYAGCASVSLAPTGAAD